MGKPGGSLRSFIPLSGKWGELTPGSLDTSLCHPVGTKKRSLSQIFEYQTFNILNGSPF
jgi:hypothetical protein